MSPTTIQKELIDEIRTIRKDLDYIKENMIDKDMILTSEEEKRLDEGIEEYNQGKAISLKDFDIRY